MTVQSPVGGSSTCDSASSCCLLFTQCSPDFSRWLSLLGMEKYLPQLLAEKDALDPAFTHALRMVTEDHLRTSYAPAPPIKTRPEEGLKSDTLDRAQDTSETQQPPLIKHAAKMILTLLDSITEIEKIQKDEENVDSTDDQYIDVVINKNMKLAQKVLIPIKQFPKFNFVGKLLGPRGNSLKRLQEDTLTKMSILGKGSMRDKAKEEELRKSGETKYFHLNDDLHVLIEVFAPPAEAYGRMGHALEEIKKFLIPDYNDEIRQAQLQELTYLNGGSENEEVPVVRGKQSVRARGAPVTTLSRGRGGVPPPSTGVPRGAPAPRGVTPARVPSTRARGLLASRARAIPPPAGYRLPPPAQDTYGEYDYDDGYGTAYDEPTYESYDNDYNSQGTEHGRLL
ncbi:KH domain-containing, RNA-binding, signal transduction-associated protein 3 isoform X1 [Bufo gargarizans]|uniref:KH domain-containing, RNA-binding, signal transduction-associated protein 3 isoform X1 n=1 Tax=Bufo gargarizans TaxID=30331 RepID=UPI001CF3D78A|nr:KH domain-containing, RNA-binding, signal transduction-associated protein 3 isoform X1 [Bufo gargarizans]XP_044150515.1 KH domain-containing, RNA-binding, signal transduction-associated protein 3 isoform X1 [Bufo gargarizans]